MKMALLWSLLPILFSIQSISQAVEHSDSELEVGVELKARISIVPTTETPEYTIASYSHIRGFTIIASKGRSFRPETKIAHFETIEEAISALQEMRNLGMTTPTKLPCVISSLWDGSYQIKRGENHILWSLQICKVSDFRYALELVKKLKAAGACQ